MVLFSKITIKPRISSNIRKFNEPYPIFNDKLFSILTIIKYLLDSISFNSRSFKNDLIKLFEKYPVVKLKAMGIPEDWLKHKGWI